MIIDSFDTNKNVFIIAEIGNNHEGHYSVAKKMIREAARAGASAVKFQTIIPERLVSIKETERIKQLEKFQLTYDQFLKLSKVAKEEGVLFLSTPFDIEVVDFLNSLVPAFKIASGDNDFFPLIKAIAETGKPVILSSGLMDLDQIKKTRDFIQSIWRKKKIKQHLAILHCVVSYPTPPEEANLLAIEDLQRLNVTVGYSDHTIGIDAAVLSVALGARIIEKHFTLDKNLSDFHDHTISADPREFSELVRKAREADKLLGVGKKTLQECEKKAMAKVRRSIATKHNLDKGAVLKWEDLVWVRPGEGLAPGSEKKVIGRKLKRSLTQGEPILLSDLQ